VLPKEHGQFSKETITFKNMCMLVKTEKSKQIRKYYVKLENIYNKIIKEEIENTKNQLQNKEKVIEQKDKLLIQTKDELKKVEIQKKHEMLLREFSYNDIYINYIMKVKTIDENKYIIKIGESRNGILNRFNAHKLVYDECIILDCWKVKMSKQFESFLHKSLNNYIYKKLPNHENENELFLVGEELSYYYINKLVNKNIDRFNENQNEISILKLELEKLKLENENLKLGKTKDIRFDYEKLKTEIKELIKTEINNNTKNNTQNNFQEHLQTIGPRVQQINPENLSLIKVFENIAEVCDKFKCPRSSISKACKENTIYINHRWNLVDRNKDENIIENLQKTKELKKLQNLGYIAKLNLNKSEILNVYLDRKTASMKNNYDSVAYLDNYVKSNKQCGEYYYVLYENCTKELKDKFEIKHKINKLILYKNGIGKYNKDNLIEEFKSVNDCQTSCNIGNKSLSKALQTGKSYNEFYYKHLDEKLMI
jgi:hypothetical protein